jgi:dTDP-4-dehydrorhamnose reductase
MACSEIGAKLIYVSTDYVFDGGKGSYSEEDETDPVNYYGLTKLKGEESVKELCDGYAVARPCAVYGWHDRKLNFTTWVIDSLRKGRHIPVVEDHYDSPTFADELAEIIKMMIRKATGVYHTAGGERVNRYEFALRIAETFDLNRSLVSPVGMKEVKSWIAQRPRDSSLCMDKLRRDMHFHPSDLTQALEKMKKTQSE